MVLTKTPNKLNPAFVPRENADIKSLEKAKAETRLRVQFLVKLSKGKTTAVSPTGIESRDVVWKMRKAYFDWQQWRREIATVMEEESYPETAILLLRQIIGHVNSGDEGSVRVTRSLLSSLANFSESLPFGINAGSKGAIEVAMGYLTHAVMVVNQHPHEDNFLKKACLQLLLNLLKTSKFVEQIYNLGALTIFPSLIDGKDEEVKCLAALCHLKLLNKRQEPGGFLDDKGVGVVFMKAIGAWLDSEARPEVRVSLQAIEALLDGLCHLCDNRENIPKLIQDGALKIIYRLLDTAIEDTGLRAVIFLMALFPNGAQNITDDATYLCSYQSFLKDISNELIMVGTHRRPANLYNSLEVAKAKNLVKALLDRVSELKAIADKAKKPSSSSSAKADNTGKPSSGSSAKSNNTNKLSSSSSSKSSSTDKPSSSSSAKRSNVDKPLSGSSDKSGPGIESDIFEVGDPDGSLQRVVQTTSSPPLSDTDKNSVSGDSSFSAFSLPEPAVVSKGDGSMNYSIIASAANWEDLGSVVFRENSSAGTMIDALDETQLRVKFLEKALEISPKNVVSTESKRVMRLMKESADEWPDDWQRGITESLVAKENLASLLASLAKNPTENYKKKPDNDLTEFLHLLYCHTNTASLHCEKLPKELTQCYDFISFVVDSLKLFQNNFKDESNKDDMIVAIVKCLLSLLVHLAPFGTCILEQQGDDAKTALDFYGELPDLADDVKKVIAEIDRCTQLNDDEGLEKNAAYEEISANALDDEEMPKNNVTVDEENRPSSSRGLEKEASKASKLPENENGRDSSAGKETVKTPVNDDNAKVNSQMVITPENKVDEEKPSSVKTPEKEKELNEPGEVVKKEYTMQEMEREITNIMRGTSKDEILLSQQQAANSLKSRPVSAVKKELSKHEEKQELPSDLKSWSSVDVRKWLKSENLFEKYGQKMNEFDGKKLSMLFSIEKKAPEYFHESLSRHFNESLPNMLLLFSGFSRLAASTYFSPENTS